MTVSVRQATLDDSSSIAAVEMLTAPEFATFMLEGLFGDASVGAILTWRYRQGGVDSTDWSWIAEAESAVIGAMGAYPVHVARAEQKDETGVAAERAAQFAPLQALMSDDAFHIARLGVLPQARRKGVATALIDTARARARDEGLKRLTLVVWADNAPALSLYERVGFEALGETSIDSHPRLARHGKILLLGETIG